MTERAEPCQKLLSLLGTGVRKIWICAVCGRNSFNIAASIFILNFFTMPKIKGPGGRSPLLCVFNGKLALAAFLSILFLGTSCISNKKVVYLQDPASEIPFDSLLTNPYNEYKLREGDILSIDVRTSDPTVTEIFRSASNINNPAMLASNASDVNYLTGFPINSNGDVMLPLVGAVHVDGLLLETAGERIRAAVEKYYKDPYVIVRLGGIRYATLGEFNRPGRYSALQSQLTIFEAISNAGDLTVLANRKEVILIRQYENGQKIHTVDLTRRDIVYSPFYYIQPNDQIYVAPLKIRELGTGVTGIPTVITFLSAVSSIILIIVSVNRL